jgi:hypothetical protein
VGRGRVAAEEGLEGEVLLGEQLREVQGCVGVEFVEGVAWVWGLITGQEMARERRRWGFLPTVLAALPVTPLPERSTCWMVGLEGDFMIFTCCEGTHGWAVTKLMSFAREYVFSLPSSKSIFVTVKVTEAVYEWILGSWLGLLASDTGVVP